MDPGDAEQGEAARSLTLQARQIRIFPATRSDRKAPIRMRRSQGTAAVPVGIRIRKPTIAKRLRGESKLGDFTRRGRPARD